MLRSALVLLCAALSLTACGSTRHGATAPPPAAKTHAHAKLCKNQAAALAKIHRDIAALKAAYKLPVKDKLLGNKAINAASDAFLLDEETAPITNLQRNRLIDLAMSAIGTHCQQCFQAFEADRPIPAIAHGQAGCSS